MTFKSLAIDLVIGFIFLLSRKITNTLARNKNTQIKFGACQVLQSHLLLLTLLCTFALACHRTRLLTVPQMFFLTSSSLQMLLPSIWHIFPFSCNISLDVPSVFSNSTLFYTCHGIPDCVGTGCRSVFPVYSIWLSRWTVSSLSSIVPSCNKKTRSSDT